MSVARRWHAGIEETSLTRVPLSNDPSTPTSIHRIGILLRTSALRSAFRRKVTLQCTIPTASTPGVLLDRPLVAVPGGLFTSYLWDLGLVQERPVKAHEAPIHHRQLEASDETTVLSVRGNLPPPD